MYFGRFKFDVVRGVFETLKIPRTLNFKVALKQTNPRDFPLPQKSIVWCLRLGINSNFGELLPWIPYGNCYGTPCLVPGARSQARLSFRIRYTVSLHTVAVCWLNWEVHALKPYLCDTKQRAYRHIWSIPFPVARSKNLYELNCAGSCDRIQFTVRWTRKRLQSIA